MSRLEALLCCLVVVADCSGPASEQASEGHDTHETAEHSHGTADWSTSTPGRT